MCYVDYFVCCGVCCVCAIVTAMCITENVVCEPQ